MSLTNWIESVRERSEGEKRRIAFYVAGSVTSLIFLVWLVAFSLTFNGSKSSTGAVTLENVNGNSSTPFSTVTRNFAAAFQAIGQKLGSFRDVVGPKTEYQAEQ